MDSALCHNMSVSRICHRINEMASALYFIQVVTDKALYNKTNTAGKTPNAVIALTDS